MGEIEMIIKWKTSVSELLSIFKGALLAIVPWVEKAKIEWSDENSYDDWDNIALALYQNIVCSSLEGEVKMNYSIAKYGFEYSDYSDLDYILVKSEMHSKKQLTFVSFKSFLEPFDGVKVAVLEKGDKVVGYLMLEMADLEFAYVKHIGGKKNIYEEIDVLT